MPELTYIYKPFPDVFFKNELCKEPPEDIRGAIADVKRAIRVIPDICDGTDIICTFHLKNQNEIIVKQIIITNERGMSDIKRWDDAGTALRVALEKLCLLVSLHDHHATLKVGYGR